MPAGIWLVTVKTGAKRNRVSIAGLWRRWFWQWLLPLVKWAGSASDSLSTARSVNQNLHQVPLQRWWRIVDALSLSLSLSLSDLSLFCIGYVTYHRYFRKQCWGEGRNWVCSPKQENPSPQVSPPPPATAPMHQACVHRLNDKERVQFDTMTIKHVMSRTKSYMLYVGRCACPEKNCSRDSGQRFGAPRSWRYLSTEKERYTLSATALVKMNSK